VDGLLTLARADAGKLDLRREWLDLKPVVEEGLELVKPLADEQGVALKARLESAAVAGDAGRLGQVVTNLLSNAVQYNRPGGTVRVRLESSGDDVMLEAADTGCGIPEEDRPHIFERFYRVDKARTRASGGHGLGLAISKGVVDAHGGTVGFDSAPGRGSTFRVRLPPSGCS
jgi:signal transduction histidine kinase